MALDFTGRVAIVTGAGGGLGRQHALALAARGAKLDPRLVITKVGDYGVEKYPEIGRASCRERVSSPV